MSTQYNVTNRINVESKNVDFVGVILSAEKIAFLRRMCFFDVKLSKMKLGPS